MVDINNPKSSPSLVGPISQALSVHSKNLFLLVAVGAIQFAVLAPLLRYSAHMDEHYGAPTPDLDLQIYTSSTHFTDLISTWGSEGCRAYTRSIYLLLRCIYIPTYAALLSAVLYRSLSQIGWDDYLRFVPQLATVMLMADFGELLVFVTGCCYGQSISPLTISVLADLCHQIKVVSILSMGLFIFVLTVLKSYLMPLLVVSNVSKGKSTIKMPSYSKASSRKGGANNEKSKTK